MTTVLIPESAGYDMSIHSNPDGLAWAKFFVETMKRIGQPHPDEDTMHGWFANAMMAMHDHVMRQPLVAPPLPDDLALGAHSVGAAVERRRR